MSPRMLLQRRLTLVMAISLAFVSGFNFDASPAISCGPMTVTWAGGQPPYTLMILPLTTPPITITIPTTAVNTYTLPSFALPPTDTSNPTSFTNPQYILMMGDATGPLSGGISDVRSVGAVQSGSSSCSTTFQEPKYEFELNSALQTCRPYNFKFDGSPVLPVTVYAVVPAGTFETITASSLSYDWTADIGGGQSVVFFVIDASGQSGGSSGIRVAAETDTTSCIGSSSPKSTPRIPLASSAASSATSTSSPLVSTSTSLTSTSATISPSGGTGSAGTGGSSGVTSSSGLPTGAYAGIAIGAAVGVLILLLAMFCWGRQRNPQASQTDIDEPGPMAQYHSGHSPVHAYSTSTGPPSPTGHGSMQSSSQGFIGAPFITQSMTGHARHPSDDTSVSMPNLYSPAPSQGISNPMYGPIFSREIPSQYTQTSEPNNSCSSGAMLHTDMEDAHHLSPQGLPPQYSDRRPFGAITAAPDDKSFWHDTAINAPTHMRNNVSRSNDNAGPSMGMSVQPEKDFNPYE